MASQSTAITGVRKPSPAEQAARMDFGAPSSAPQTSTYRQDQLRSAYQPPTARNSKVTSPGRYAGEAPPSRQGYTLSIPPPIKKVDPIPATSSGVLSSIDSGGGDSAGFDSGTQGGYSESSNPFDAGPSSIAKGMTSAVAAAGQYQQGDTLGAVKSGYGAVNSLTGGALTDALSGVADDTFDMAATGAELGNSILGVPGQAVGATVGMTLGAAKDLTDQITGLFGIGESKSKKADDVGPVNFNVDDTYGFNDALSGLSTTALGIASRSPGFIDEGLNTMTRGRSEDVFDALAPATHEAVHSINDLSATWGPVAANLAAPFSLARGFVEDTVIRAANAVFGKNYSLYPMSRFSETDSSGRQNQSNWSSVSPSGEPYQSSYSEAQSKGDSGSFDSSTGGYGETGASFQSTQDAPSLSETNPETGQAWESSWESSDAGGSSAAGSAGSFGDTSSGFGGGFGTAANADSIGAYSAGMDAYGGYGGGLGGDAGADGNGGGGNGDSDGGDSYLCSAIHNYDEITVEEWGILRELKDHCGKNEMRALRIYLVEGPELLKKMKAAGCGDSFFVKLKDDLVKRCIELIRAGNMKEALEHYINFTVSLFKEYAPDMKGASYG